MSIPEMKEKLIAKIKQTNDEALLEEISNLIELGEAEGIYTLNESRRLAVKEAREQIKDGDSLSNEEADKEIEQWLSESFDQGVQ